MATPNLALATVPSNSLQPSVAINSSLQILDALVQLRVQDKDLTAPPTTVLADAGKVWIVGATATGAWAGHDGELALCTAADVWSYLVPQEGWRAEVLDESAIYRYDGSAWSFAGAGTAADLSYDNTASGLAAINVQDAVDEIEALVVAGGTWATVKKTADESRASTTTLTDDSQLKFSASAGSTYAIRARLVFEVANGTMDIQCVPVFSGAAASILRRLTFYASGSTSGVSALASTFGTLTPDFTAAGLGFAEYDIVFTASTPGTFSFQWAQNTSNASNLTMHAGSYLEYMTVS